jgi:hypothetical protein
MLVPYCSLILPLHLASHDQSQLLTSTREQDRQQISKKKLHLERNEMQWVSRQQVVNDDDDLNFFKSLAPYMKKLSPYKKLCLRSKIENLLANEISVIESNSVHLSTAPKTRTVVETEESHAT